MSLCQVISAPVTRDVTGLIKNVARCENVALFLFPSAVKI